MENNDVFSDILKYRWFLPSETIVKKTLCSLVQEHQERLKPFGCAQIYPCQTIKIWPGEAAESIIQKETQTKKSLLQMFIDNCLQILRIMNLEAGKLQRIDFFLREKEHILRSLIRDAAIESCGLTVRATTTIPKSKHKKFFTESDIVDLAVEGALNISLWHLCWTISEGELDSLKKYLNPFFPLMKIFALGLWPLGIVENQYLILVPRDAKIDE